MKYSIHITVGTFIILTIIGVAIAIYMRSRREYFDTLNQYTYVQDPTTGLWDTAPKGYYTCPQTTVDGYCIVPQDQAQTICSNDPNCIGYVQGAAAQNPNNLAQLVSQGVAPNQYTTGSTYFKKTLNSQNITPAPQPINGLSDFATRLISLINQSPNCQSLTNLKPQFVNNSQLSSLDMYNIVNAYQTKYTALSCGGIPPSPTPSPTPTPSPLPIPSGNIPSTSLTPSTLDGVFVAKYVGPVPSGAMPLLQ